VFQPTLPAHMHALRQSVLTTVCCYKTLQLYRIARTSKLPNERNAVDLNMYKLPMLKLSVQVKSLPIFQGYSTLRRFISSQLGLSTYHRADKMEYIEHDLQACYGNLSIELRLLLTVPASVATAERSFSKLKLKPFTEPLWLMKD